MGKDYTAYTLGVISIMAALAVFIVPNPWALPAFIVACITLVILVTRTILDICKAKFKARVDRYIAEGQDIVEKFADTTISTADYLVLERTWSKKVSEDIRCHKGQLQMERFLAKATTREFESRQSVGDIELQEVRSLADQIVATRLRQLQELWKRL